jgi:hypothetical protein
MVSGRHYTTAFALTAPLIVFGTVAKEERTERGCSRGFTHTDRAGEDEPVRQVVGRQRFADPSDRFVLSEKI